MSSPHIRSALISVSDKAGIVEFAKGLRTAGVELYSTGGTRRFLESHAIQVQDITRYTGFPEMLGGRVKTLHPMVFGGILARRDFEPDMETLDEYGMVSFDLVVVNLYPFEQTIDRDGISDAEAIEQIDIGGPSLIRAAAKNHEAVTICTDPAQYPMILAQVQSSRGTTPELRRDLAVAAFRRTCEYDRVIAEFFSQKSSAREEYPANLSLHWQRREVLRYGENPHQTAAFYVEAHPVGASLANARQLHGKELSYNNLLDLDAALSLARALPEAGAVIIKHNNPCGAACAGSLVEAFRLAYDADPVSAFGCILAFNRRVDVSTAEALAEPGRFVEALLAPGFDPEAIQVLTTKPTWRNNVRLLEIGSLDPPSGWDLRGLAGGLLVQQRDQGIDPESEWKVVTDRTPSDNEWHDLRFGWQVARLVKSNAIVVAKDRCTRGVGAGQMSRVDSVQIALSKAGAQAAGASLASDAFFPFADSIELATKAGITAFIQPGGSKRDAEVIASCNAAGAAMVFTQRRHFKH